MPHSDYTGFYLQEQEEKKNEQVNETVQYEEYSRSELEKVKKDDLKTRLDQLEIEYESNAVKNELIDLLVGEENQKDDENAKGETEQGYEEGQADEAEQEETVEEGEPDGRK